MNKTTLLSIGLLIAFFLPWIDLNIITISGYEIPTSLDKLSNLSNLLNDGNNNSTKYSYILYLIPLLSIISIYKELTNNKRAFINEFQFGIIATIYLFFTVKNYDKDFTSLFSLGYYLTAIFSFIGFLICLFQKNENLIDSRTVLSEESKNIPSFDKNDLLKQLEQLHTLKEKNILSDYIYEQEKNEILEKIKNKKDLKEANVNVENEEQAHKTIYEQFQNKKTLILSFIGVLILIFAGYSYLKSKEPYQQKMIGIWKLPDETFFECQQDSILILLDKEGKNYENAEKGRYSASEKDNELILQIPTGDGYSVDNYKAKIIKFESNKIILKPKGAKELILIKQ